MKVEDQVEEVEVKVLQPMEQVSWVVVEEVEYFSWGAFILLKREEVEEGWLICSMGGYCWSL